MKPLILSLYPFGHQDGIRGVQGRALDKIPPLGESETVERNLPAQRGFVERRSGEASVKDQLSPPEGQPGCFVLVSPSAVLGEKCPMCVR